MAKILMIATGGTIGGQVAKSEESTTKKDIVKPEGFINSISPTLKNIEESWGLKADIKLIELDNVDSSDILPKHWSGIADTIKDQYNNYDAFLVTHGTNTMGYTSAAITYALGKLGKPVILTGAQVPFGSPGSDALMNLENSLRICLWPYHKLAGVMVVFGSNIITGARAKKSTEFDYDAFKAFKSASLGHIGRVIIINEDNLAKHLSYIQPLALKASSLDVKSKFDMNIASLTEFPGMSVDIIKRLHQNEGVKGIIFRAFGAGDISNHLEEAVRYLADNEIPLVVTTQAPNGDANMQVNEPGQKLKENDWAIPMYDMSIESMTTKLAWLIGQELSYEEIKAKMIANLRGEIVVREDMR